MTTLHIDITINDLSAFRTAFTNHAEMRRDGGVVAERISQVTGEEGHLQIELDFTSPDQAEAFLVLLREGVWKDNPVISGTPQPTILEPVGLVSA